MLAPVKVQKQEEISFRIFFPVSLDSSEENETPSLSLHLNTKRKSLFIHRCLEGPILLSAFHNRNQRKLSQFWTGLAGGKEDRHALLYDLFNRQSCPGKGQERQDSWLPFFSVSHAGQIHPERCVSIWGPRICSLESISTVPNTLYSCCNLPAVSSQAKCEGIILIPFLILSFPTLISYRDSRVDVNQSRLVEGRCLRNELFKYVCTLTYKLLKGRCDLLGEGQEMLPQSFPHSG